MTDRPTTTEPITYGAYVARAHQQARRAHRLAQIAFRDDLELSLTGGCPSCGLEADDMCAACQRCNCDTHETCVRRRRARGRNPMNTTNTTPGGLTPTDAAVQRIRDYLRLLPGTVNLGAEFAYSSVFRSEGWPHDAYPLTREDVEALLAALDQVRALAATCVCGTPGLNYDGPAEDCPVHGAVQGLNKALAELDRTRAERDEERRARDTIGGALILAGMAPTDAEWPNMLPALKRLIADRDGLRQAMAAERLATEGAVTQAADVLERMTDGPALVGVPRRGDVVEAWLKVQRDEYHQRTAPQWQALDEVLDTYRLHADTGTPLDQHVCEARTVGDCDCQEQTGGESRG